MIKCVSIRASPIYLQISISTADSKNKRVNRNLQSIAKVKL